MDPCLQRRMIICFVMLGGARNVLLLYMYLHVASWGINLDKTVNSKLGITVNTDICVSPELHAVGTRTR